MCAQVINPVTVFQGQDKRQARGEPEIRVQRYRGPLASLNQVVADAGGLVVDYEIRNETGPSPELILTLDRAFTQTSDTQAEQESAWELVSYGVEIPLRRADYFKDEAVAVQLEISDIAGFLDLGDRTKWADIRDLKSDTSFSAKAEKYLEFRDQLAIDSVTSTRWMIRQTILAAKSSQLKPSMSGIDEIDSSPPVPSSAKFSVSSIGGVWVKRAPQVMSAGRQRFRIVQSWENGRTEDFPSELYGGS